MKKKELERCLRHLDWRLLRQGAKHEVWTNGRFKIAVPRHREIREFTALKILKEAEMYNNWLDRK